MIKGGGSQSDSRLPLSSPLQESSLSGSGTPNLVAFSLLGQQMKKFTSPQQQQSHHQSSNAEFLQFPLSGNSQHNHQQSQPHQREPKVLGMFQNSRQPPNVGQSFGQQQQQQFSGQMAAAKQGSLQDNTTNHLLGGDMPVQVLMNGLAMLQQKVQQLQALVPLLTQSVHGQSNASVVIAQQQAASAAVSSILAELVAAANSMLPQHVPAAAAVQQSNKVPNLELSQLLCAGTNNQNLNFFQQSGLDSPLGTSLGTSLGDLLGNKLFGNSFLSPDGLERSGFGGTGGVGGGGESGLGNDGHGFGNGGGSAGSEVAWHKELAGQQHVAKDESSKGMLRVQKENLLEKPHSNGHGVGRSGGIQVGSHGMSGSAAGSSLVGNNAVGAHHESRGMSTARPEEHDASFGADEDDGVVENLTPGSYDLVEMDAMEILAEHTHFCEICGKGFKRDANLRMHMRGHGDEYKTPAALAKPEKASNSQLLSVARPRRYSCPYMGCKRNKKHRKFLPLKTMLCVKNHYRRSHCPKMLTCTKCNLKKFSVVADLKTHEKHCGRDKWQCSCGTTFSRKDKLFGHVSLFAGHTPATPMDVEMEEGNAPLDAEFSAHGNNSRAAGFMSGSATGTHFASHVGGSRRGSEKRSEMGRMSSAGGMGLQLSAGGMGLQLGAGGISKNNHDTSPPASSYSQNAMLQGLFTNTFLQSSSGNASSDGLH